MPTSKHFSIEILPDAWTGVGRVPTPIFDRIKRELAHRAELAALEAQLGTGVDLGTSRVVFTVGEFEAAYRIDDVRRVIQLLSVSRRAA